MMGKLASMLPWLLIGGGTFIIQYHSMEFWSINVNQYIGWVWSLVIEGGSLWLWYRPGLASRTLGMAASILLLAGPLYQIGGQAVMAGARAKASEDAAQAARKASAQVRAITAQTAQTAHARLAQDARLLRAYMENSRKRVGWLPAIQSLQKRMDTEQARLNTLNAKLSNLINKPGKPYEYVANKGVSVVLLVFLQALGLILIQVTNILAIAHISRKARGPTISAHYVRNRAHNAHLWLKQTKTRNNEPDNPPLAQKPAQTAQDDCAVLRGLAQSAHGWIKQERLSIAGAALKLGVERQNLSYLLRWEAPGDRKPTGLILEKIRAGVEHRRRKTT